MKILSKILLATVTTCVIASAASAKELKMLTWEGYADKSFTEEFTKKTGCEVKPKYVGSGDEIATTMLTGRGTDYDLFAVSSDLVPRFIDAGVVDPIDMSKIPNAEGFFPQFKQPEFGMRDGKQYALPYAFGVIRLTVDPTQLDVKPDSLAYLWDPALKGKAALWDDLESLYMAGRYLGFKDVYNMTDEELEKAKEALIELKPNIRKFWSSAGELSSLYQQKDIATSNSWDIVVTTMLKDDQPIELVQPKEGLGGWIDSYMIVAGHSENECVHEWLNYTSDPKVAAIAFKVTSYMYANSSMVDFLDEGDKKMFEALGATSQDAWKNIDWWRPVKNRGKYMQIWNQVKSATSN